MNQKDEHPGAGLLAHASAPRAKNSAPVQLHPLGPADFASAGKLAAVRAYCYGASESTQLAFGTPPSWKFA